MTAQSRGKFMKAVFGGLVKDSAASIDSSTAAAILAATAGAGDPQVKKAGLLVMYTLLLLCWIVDRQDDRWRAGAWTGRQRGPEHDGGDHERGQRHQRGRVHGGGQCTVKFTYHYVLYNIR